MTFSLELFATPVLTASLSSPFPEGSPVTLSCVTKLPPQSPGLQLYFSFYVGSETLEDRKTSAEYHIPSAKREDSGLYWCEAATEDGSVRKRSPELELRTPGECGAVGAPFPPPSEREPLVSRAPHFVRCCRFPPASPEFPSLSFPVTFLFLLSFIPFLLLLPLSVSLPQLLLNFPFPPPSPVSYRKHY